MLVTNVLLVLKILGIENFRATNEGYIFQVCDETGCAQVRVGCSLEQAGLNNILEVENIVSFRNLQVRGDKVPSLYVTQATLTSINPKSECHVTAMKNVKKFMESSKDLVDEYLNDFSKLKLNATKNLARPRSSLGSASMSNSFSSTPLRNTSVVSRKVFVMSLDL